MTTKAIIADDTTNGSAIIEQDAKLAKARQAAEAFKAYAEGRDDFLTLPFARNTSLAASGASFTILKAGERFTEPPDRPGELLPCFCYLIELAQPYTHHDRLTGERIEYSVGDQQLLSLVKNAVRGSDNKQLTDLLARFGSIADLSLQLYPPSDPAMNPAVGIVHCDNWKPYKEMLAAASA